MMIKNDVGVSQLGRIACYPERQVEGSNPSTHNNN